MSEIKEENIKVITFSGRKSDWTAWEEKFMARAKRRGYKKLLQDKLGAGVKIPTETEADLLDPTVDEDKAALKIVEANELAYSDLVLAVDTSRSQGRVVMNLIRNSKTKDYPDGNALVAWKSLRRKFTSTTAPSIAKLHKQFYQAKLKKGVDPVSFIVYLEDLRSRLEEAKQTMTDEHFVLQAMQSLTQAYSTEVRLVEEKIDDGKSVSIDDLKERLSLQYERKTTYEDHDEDSDSDDDEKALTSIGFKGKCYNCGKYGH